MQADSSGEQGQEEEEQGQEEEATASHQRRLRFVCGRPARHEIIYKFHGVALKKRI